MGPEPSGTTSPRGPLNPSLLHSSQAVCLKVIASVVRTEIFLQSSWTATFMVDRAVRGLSNLTVGFLSLPSRCVGLSSRKHVWAAPYPHSQYPRPPPETEGAPGKMLHFPFCEFSWGPALRHLGMASNSVNKAVSYLPKGAPSFR